MTEASLGYRRAAPDDLAGSIRVKVARHRDRTRPVITESHGVLRLMHPLYLDDSGQLTYIVMNPGGAYFGEAYRYDIDLGPNSSLLLSSQAATRIHRTPTRPAVQETTIVLGSGSRLEYVPDQLIAYRDADYRQFTTIVAAPDAQGFFAEAVTPGWDPDDSKFTYSGIHLRLDIRAAGHAGLVCTDNVRLRPSEIDQAIDGLGYLEGASHMGSILVFGPHIDDGYEDCVRGTVTQSGLAKAGVTRGSRHGVAWLMVRALANSTDELNRLTLAVNELDRSVTTGQSRMDLRRY
ncbi:MAG TPA: urease accessory protein UreD [Thermomicrobiales bacterium]|nr:urease accessory protein UreD [Thermomicrobiales bacterium]HQZ89118.1 urease accessory protein UreD [Thermomicrobiales bacterium]HRA31827.1 urease accessory protein UreD [Thermomicrobiales bacterium]